MKAMAPEPGSGSESDEDSDGGRDDVPVQPREMVKDARHFTTLELDGADSLDRFLSCPVCLGMMTAPTATECLHRFCSDCIETSLRIGKKECPSCRFPIKTRRGLRRDFNFESLMNTLYPDGMQEEVVDIAATLRMFQHKPLGNAGTPMSPAAAEQRNKTEGSARRDSRGGASGRTPKVPLPAPTPAEEPQVEEAPAAVRWSCPQVRNECTGRMRTGRMCTGHVCTGRVCTGRMRMHVHGIHVWWSYRLWYASITLALTLTSMHTYVHLYAYAACVPGT